MSDGQDHGLLRSYTVLECSAAAPSAVRRLLMRMMSLAWPRLPYPLRSHDDREVIHRLKSMLSGQHFDVGIWVTPAFADKGLRVLRACCDRVVYDAIDSSYSAMNKEPGKSILFRWDAFWVKRWERALSSRADAAVYISKGDIELLGRGSRNFRYEVLHLPNGVLIDDFTSDRVQIDGIEPGDFVIGFLGNMAYPPNVRAAQRLARIFRSVRHQLDNAKLVIIGKSPTVSVQQLGRDEGVVVTGAVDNIWGYVNRVSVFVFPMETGAGPQNKVIEAMFAKRPVVATPIANLGVGARPNAEILIGITDEEITQWLLRFFGYRSLAERLGQSRHDFVTGNCSWEALLPRFEDAIFGSSIKSD